MPILIGPGSISASIVIGERLPFIRAAASIFIAVCASIAIMMILKALHDSISKKKEILIERYIEIMVRITALVVGTFAIDMIMNGLKDSIK